MKKTNAKKRQKPLEIIRTQLFAGVIRRDPTDGRLKKLIVKSTRWYQHQINKFRDGEQVTLEVHNKRPKRTDQQNRYLWGVYYPLIAKETGELNVDRLHELFKGLFLTEGVVEVLGRKVRMKKSTTELGIAEFCEYIMAIESETGIAAPPTENYDLTPLTYSSGSVSLDHEDKPHEIVEDFLPETPPKDTEESTGLEKPKPRRNQKKTA